LKPTTLCGKPPRGLQAQFPPIKKQNERWAKSDEEKAETFASYLSKVFKSHPREIIIDEEKKLLTDTNIPAKMVAPAKLFTIKEVRAAIRVLNPKKAPGYDLISNQVLQKLPEKDYKIYHPIL